MSNDTEIGPEAAAHVLHAFGEGGYAPGGFYTKLIEAAMIADAENMARLAVGFPAYVAAIRAAKYEPGGIDRLRALLGGGS